MTIERFEDVLAWQKARVLTREIYMAFRHVKDFGFRDQIERAAVSVMNNIAEGFERRSDKEFSNFLNIAKGSCGEVRSMLWLGHDLEYSNGDSSKKLIASAEEISRLIAGFAASLR